MTTLIEKLETIQYLTDTEGRRLAVVIDFDIWEELLTLIEDLEEGRERLVAQVNESQQAYEVDQVQRGAVDDFMVEIDNSYSYQQPPRGLTSTPKFVIEPDPQQAIANQGAIDLLRSWRESDIEEQAKIWTYLQNALDEDRLSDRPFFP
jgi:hypothetical protein